MKCYELGHHTSEFDVTEDSLREFTEFAFAGSLLDVRTGQNKKYEYINLRNFFNNFISLVHRRQHNRPQDGYGCN